VGDLPFTLFQAVVDIAGALHTFLAAFGHDDTCTTAADADRDLATSVKVSIAKFVNKVVV
jgi:hypothetical protein